MSSSEFQTELASLSRMARAPGFKEAAWHEAKRLDAHSSGLWSGMAKALVDAMRTAGASKQEMKGRTA